jgi:hypothetical protein
MVPSRRKIYNTVVKNDERVIVERRIGSPLNACGREHATDCNGHFSVPDRESTRWGGMRSIPPRYPQAAFRIEPKTALVPPQRERHKILLASLRVVPDNLKDAGHLLKDFLYSSDTKSND